jgi:putative CocE/NonD family hydrolase
MLREIGTILICLLPLLLGAQNNTHVRERYTKSVHSVLMRDGVKLFTIVYEPKDKSRKYPILFNRTPYGIGPYGPDEYRAELGPNNLLENSGYIFVYQDVRGKYMSEGVFVDVRPYKKVRNGSKDIDESTDAWDSISWLLKNINNNNGKVGMWGISYPGFYAAMGALSRHPNLVAVSPQAPVMDWFTGDDFHHNGAFFLSHAFNFFSSFGKVRNNLTIERNPPFRYDTEDGYHFYRQMGSLENANRKFLNYEIPFWNDLMAHPDYDDFWKERNPLPHFTNLKAATLVVGGFNDAENLYGALQLYKSIEKNNPGGANFLVMGPWSHGQWARDDGQQLGPVSFDSKTSLFYRKEIESEFFNHYLKGETELELPEAYVFETGSNVWKAYKQWPPRESEAKELFLMPSEGLALGTTGLSQRESFSEYVSDPARPVPYIDSVSIRMNKYYMVGDQRFASRRTDVLVFESPVLNEEITMTGPMMADLFVSSSANDVDLVVKLIDVYPDNEPRKEGRSSMGGYQMMVRGDVMRCRYRKSLSKPEAMQVDEIAEVKFQLNDVNHTFRKGHKIMVQIQSSWFPLVDINPQKFVNIYSAAKDDFQKARVRVFHTSRFPSHLSFSQLRK